MSIFPTGLSVAIAAAENILSAVIFRQRSIGGFIADVTVEEDHHDELIVTDHPVEQGASITDHAFKRPARLSVRAGWSNSSLNAFGDPNYIQEVYSALLAMQAARGPFDVITGKRYYTNMLITALRERTDQKFENAMILTIEMREVILVTTQTVTVPSTANMTMPQNTGGDVNRGTVSAVPGTNFNAAMAP